MDLKTAQQTLSTWIENEGTGVYAPEYLLALVACALTDDELDQNIFSVLRKKEGDPAEWSLWIRDWSLWAYYTVMVYAKRRPLNAEITAELVHIKKIAAEFLEEHHSFNPWAYHLSCNPIQSIVYILDSCGM